MKYYGKSEREMRLELATLCLEAAERKASDGLLDQPLASFYSEIYIRFRCCSNGLGICVMR